MSRLRELFRLIVGAPNNPLVAFDAPWRRGWAPRAFLLLQVVVAALIMVPAAMMAAERLAEADRGYSDGAAWSFFAAFVVIASAVTFPFNMVVFASRWGRRDNLEELWRTRLSEREIAFGQVFWGVVCGAVVPGAGTLCVLLLTATDSQPLDAIVAPMLSPFVLAAAACLAVRQWFIRQNAHVVILITVPLQMASLGILSLVTVGPPTALLYQWIRDATGNYTVDFSVILVPIMAVWAVGLLAFLASRACELAPTRLFAALFPERPPRLDAIASVIAFRRQRDRRTELLAKNAALPRPRVRLGMAAASVMLVVAVAADFLFLRDDFRGYCAIVGAVLAPAAAFMMIGVREGWSCWQWQINGMGLRRFAVPALQCMAPSMVVAAVAIAFIAFRMSGIERVYGALAALFAAAVGAGLTLLQCLVPTLVAMISTSPRRTFVAYLAWFLALYVAMLGVAARSVHIQGDDPFFYLALGALIVLWWHALAMPWAVQAFHTRRVARAEWGEVAQP